MLRLRLLTGIPLAALVVAITVVGGGWFLLGIMMAFGAAAVEFVHLAARRGHRAFGGLILLWMLLFVFDRYFPDLGLLGPGVSLLLIATLGWALIRFRQGTANAMTGFALTIAGGLYIGWTAAQFISLRDLKDGLFWTLTVYVAVWGSDSLAYLAGRAFGRTPLIYDVSPRKTWEGYLVAILGTTVITGAFMPLWRSLGAGPDFTPIHGLMIGLLISAIGPLGDVGMSMFKRYARAKDSGQIIPGHGGFLDRIDVLMIGGLLGYYYIFYVVLCRAGGPPGA